MRKNVSGIPVEWDDRKNKLNMAKHKLSFEDAALVFADVNRLEFPDAAHSSEESRYKVLGMVNEVLFVVYTERGETARIITARKATPKERRTYYDCSQNYL